MLRRVLPIGLIALLGIPLVFGKFLLYPFVVYRTYLFFLLVDALFCLFLFSSWRAAAWRTVTRNRIVLAAGVFLLVKFVTDAAGIAPGNSFFGTYDRMMGWLTWLHAFLYFVMIVTVFSEERQYQALCRWVAVVGGLVSLYGILQHYDVAFRIQRLDERVFSTVGNPAFLAGFLLITLFLGGLALCEKNRRLWQWMLAGSLGLSLWALLLTATRGALLGFFVAGIFLLSFFLFQAKRRRLFVFALVAVAAMPMALFFLRQTAFVKNTLVLRRLTTISFADPTIQSRIFLWKSAGAGAAERPFFGYGEANAAVPLDRHFDPRILESWADSSHNIFFDLALAHGLLGITAFAVLAGSVVWSFARRRRERPCPAVFGLTACIAYGVQGMFIFDTLVVLLPMTVVAGYAAVLSPVADSEVRQTSTDRAEKFFSVVITALLLALSLSYVRGVRAISELSSGHRSARKDGDVAAATAAFRSAESLAFFGFGNLAQVTRDTVWYALNHTPAFEKDDVRALVSHYASVTERALAHEGRTSMLLGDLANVLLLAPRDVGGQDVHRIMLLLDEATQLSPYRFDLVVMKAHALVASGNPAEAVMMLTDALPRFPRRTEEIQAFIDRVAPRNGS